MRYYAIGDLHGMFDHLKTLMDVILFTQSPGTIITLGDYVDRGPDSKKVLDYLMEFNEPDFPMINLKGNHEDMMCDYLNQDLWKYNGGMETLESFDYEDVPTKYINWARELPTFYETDDYIFVHAGLYPGHTAEQTPEHHRMWIRDEFLTTTYNWGKLVVHGHTPRKEITESINRLNIDTGACFEEYGMGKLTCAILDGKDKPVNYIQVYNDPITEQLTILHSKSKRWI